MRVVDEVRPWGNLNIGSTIEDFARLVAEFSPNSSVVVDFIEDRVEAHRDGKKTVLADGMELQEIWHKFRERLAKLDE